MAPVSDKSVPITWECPRCHAITESPKMIAPAAWKWECLIGKVIAAWVCLCPACQEVGGE